MRLEQQIINQALYAWGSYESHQMDKSYYPSITPLYRFKMEGAPGKPVFSSTILHFGTPQEILKIRQSVERLPEQQKRVVFTKYVFRGITDQEKAKALEINYNTYKSHLNRAQQRLMAWM